ncbi:LysR substrate-binding domain-containing protein [Paraburkholderia sp.]|uniref:LysR substrate-binding domain-containing protein n=1 Tax=Paraburkholderia sp. TaxID=1926495 RepID=UPI002F407388
MPSPPDNPLSISVAAKASESECRAVLAGLGFGQVASYLAQPYQRSGKLVSVLDDETPEPWSICVYRPQRGHVPPRVRLVFDTMSKPCRDPIFRAATGDLSRHVVAPPNL